MLDIISGINPIVQALIATIFTWFLTACGAATVFFKKHMSRKMLDAMLGFAGGVMVAASYWSLLAPAIQISADLPTPVWFPPAVGFALGSLFLFAIDKILPHLHVYGAVEEAEGIKTTWDRSILLVLAITLHNIPEGLAVGVAFGGAAAGLKSASLTGAIALAIGIGIQNFPEGVAVAMPLRREGVSRGKSFWFGQLSAVVEPIGGVVGAALVLVALPLLPYALSFAAGAMIYVVIEEVIPESQKEKNTDIATLAFLLGFIVMMVLDVALG